MRHKHRKLTILSIVLVWAGACSAEAAPSAVFLRNQEVCVLGEGSPLRCLTHDGTDKAAPRWAPDGRRIAYVQRSGLRGMFARVVVMDEHGSVLQRMPIGAVGPGNDGYGMMTTVADLRWLGTRRLVVEGHLNPSDSEYVLFDTESGATVAEIGDQSLGAGFSPDGLNWAVVSGVPHFSGAAETTPTLEVGGRDVLVLKGGDASFASPPLWSDDAGRVAILIRRGEDGPVNQMALGEAVVGNTRIFDLPFSEERVELGWCAGDPCVMREVPEPALRSVMPDVNALRPQWWRLRAGSWEPMPAPAANAERDARRAALAERVRRLGGLDADVR